MSKFITKILLEAETTNHFEQRLGERFLSKPFLNVGYEVGRNDFETIGTWELKQEYKTQLSDSISFLESVKFPINKSYAIRLFKIRIDIKDVNFYSEEDKLKAQHKPLIVVDDVHTNGDTCYAIIQSNKLVSIYFVRSSVQHQFNVDVKMNLDSIKQHMNSKQQLVNESENRKQIFHFVNKAKLDNLLSTDEIKPRWKKLINNKIEIGTSMTWDVNNPTIRNMNYEFKLILNEELLKKDYKTFLVNGSRSHLETMSHLKPNLYDPTAYQFESETPDELFVLGTIKPLKKYLIKIIPLKS